VHGQVEPVFGRRRPYLRIVATIATLLISAFILGYLVYNQRETLTEFKFRIQPLPLIAAFIIFSLDLGLVALIWGWMMNALGERVSIWKHIRIYYVSNITKRIPGTIWYIASRAQFYQQIGISRRLTTVASGMEFAIALLTSGIVAIVFSLSLLTENKLNLIGVGLVVLLSLVASQPTVISWLFRKLNIEARQFSTIQLLQWMITYICAWCLSGLVVFAIGASIVDLDIANLGYIIGSVSLVNIITSAFFFAPSNLGITEVSLSLLLSRIMPAPYAVLVSIATRILILSFEAFWAVIFIWLKR
jgi:glycosyltransferase 2 family protein